MVFGIQKLQDQVFCLTEERDYFQAKFLEQVSEIQALKDELHKAFQHSSKIVHGLNKDYGAYLKTPDGISMIDNLHWALCHVTSRATAGSEKYGALRMIPMADMINHDASAGGFVELTGKEKLGEYILFDVLITGLFHICCYACPLIL